MRFKLDENLGTSAAETLIELGHDVHSAFEEGLAGWPDIDVLAACILEERVLITFDKGFGELSRASSHAGLILLRLTDQRPVQVGHALARAVEHIADVDIRRSVVVVQAGGIRIRQG